MDPLLVHIAEARTRYAKPLCKSASRATAYTPQATELVWLLSQATPPARVQLGGTGFTVPVSMIEDVEAQRGRSCKACDECKKALAGMEAAQ